MASVAIIDKDGLVLNVAFFSDEDIDGNVFDLSTLFEGVYGAGSYGVVLGDKDRTEIGDTYVDGHFLPKPMPEPTKEQLVMEAQAQKRTLSSAAKDIFVTWQTKLLLNRATEAEKAALNEWIDYFEEIQSVDVSNAPDIEWPEQPPIPEAAQ